MESLTYLKNIRLSPKKLRFYLKNLKTMSPGEAVKNLYYGKQKATRVFYKALKSAISNAESALKTDVSLLNFKLFTVEEGQTLKRYRPGARGNVRPIKKHMSHIKIILDVKPEAKNKPKVVKEIAKPDKKVEVQKPKSKAKVKK